MTLKLKGVGKKDFILFYLFFLTHMMHILDRLKRKRIATKLKGTSKHCFCDGCRRKEKIYRGPLGIINLYAD
jgi:hypothetical protein